MAHLLLGTLSACLVLAGFGQVLLRGALRRAQRPGDDTPAGRYRAGLRKLYPVAFAMPLAFIWCVQLLNRDATLWDRPGPVVLVVVMGFLLPVLAGIPFIQYHRRIAAPALRRWVHLVAPAQRLALQLLALASTLAVTVTIAAVLPTLMAAPALKRPLLIAAVLVSVVVNFAAYPLFLRWVYHATPLRDLTLESAVRQLQARSGWKITGLYRVASPLEQANAFVSGILPWRRDVFITDTLMRALSPAETAAIVAHELAHLKRRHLPKQMAIAIVTIVMMMGGMFAVRRVAPDGPLPYALVAMLVAGLVSVVIRLPRSRTHETEADMLAASWVGADLYAQALRRVHALNLNDVPNTTVERWASTHPDLPSRLETINGQANSKPGSEPRR